MSTFLQKDCKDLLQGSNNILSLMVELLETWDPLHLSNNILHPHGGLIHLKTNPRDKIECSRFAKKVIYSNVERIKNSQLWSTAS